MKKLLINFLYFCQTGNSYHEIQNTSSVDKFTFIGKTLMLLFLFKCLIAIISTYLNKHGLIDPYKGNGDLILWHNETSTVRFILEVVILAPLLEEFAFRGLFQSDRFTVIIAFIILFYLIVCVLSHINFYTVTSKTLFISFFCIFLGITLNKFPVDQFIDFIYKYKIYVIWLFSFAFALWHYNNYDFIKARAQTILIALLPHFVSGLIFSWTSLKYGLKWSIILHVINNAIPSLIVIW